jgi:GntR family transcriptional regulator, transcriptional repressor for pyruvate dehydrogenase complex
MEEIQAYERVMNILVRQIFSRQLKPGDKLPSERQLAKDIHVDRASLRIALKHMEMMNVLTIRQGDGIYVREYMKGASIDFLRMLFLQTEAPDNEWLIDPYILDEVWEFWVFFLPESLKIAATRFASRDIKAMIDIFDEELANLHDRVRVVELELKSQEFVAEVGNNIVVILIMHTCRPLRKKMIEIFFSSLNDEQIKNHVEMKKELMRSYMTLDAPDSISLVEKYRELLNSYRSNMRKLLFNHSGKELKSRKPKKKAPLIGSR